MSETMQMNEDRQLRIEDYLAQDKAVPCEEHEVSAFAKNNEKGKSNIEQSKILLEKICEYNNMKNACKRVVANKGIGGVDGMSVDGLPE